MSLFTFSGRSGYKWFLLVILFVTFFLEQGARQVYNITIPLIKADFAGLGVSDVQIGAVGTAFTFVFGIGLLLAGAVSDLLSRKLVLIGGTLLFSLGIFGTGFANGIAALVVCYGIITGMGQCCVAPPCYSLISEYHVSTRALAMSIFNSANYLGVIVCSCFAGFVGGMGEGAWRWSFWLLGAIGILVALVVLTPFVPAEGTTGRTEGKKASVKDGFTTICRNPSAMMMAFAFLMIIYGQMGFMLWIPTFLLREFRRLSPAMAGFHAAFWTSVGAIVGLLVFARVADGLACRRKAVRVEGAAIGAFACAVSILCVASCSNLRTMVVALLLFGVARGIWDANYYPAFFDFIPQKFRSASVGVCGCMAFVIGSAAPSALGWISDHMSLRIGLSSLAAFYLVGMAVVCVVRIFTFKRHFLEEGEGK